MKIIKKLKQTSKPLVSVVMPVYNAGRFLSEAIDSILNQTYRKFEFIIIDDASTDESWSVIKQYKRKYPKKIFAIRMAKNMNRGGDTCASEGIKRARGQYIARMDADDISHPERLAKQVAYLQKHQDIFMVGSSAYVINGDGKRTGEKNMPTTNEAIYREYFTFHPMIHPTIMFRNGVVKQKPFYKTVLPTNNDYYTFFEFISKGLKFANMSEHLLHYRIYGKNDSLRHIKKSFLNTLRARWSIYKTYGYPLDLRTVVQNLTQCAVVLLLPESITYFIYLFARKILDRQLLVAYLKEQLRFPSLVLQKARVFASVFMA
ncbi:MAG: glycosyltransferase [Patescibacteria group bacterium]|jgi:glycosyltransferase involved in cell wall biosynthesis